MIKKIWKVLNFVRTIPAIIAYKSSKQREVISKDIDSWVRINNMLDMNLSKSQYLQWLLMYRKEFRNLFYNRMDNRFQITLLTIFYPKLNSLYIETKNIGTGLFISHGFSTIILANSIGQDCWINQQVTIGTKNGEPVSPTIGNRVRIGAGAIVIGNIKIGDNSFIGAGAVVTKDVPENSVVVGNPAFLLKKDGVRVDKKL